MSATGTNYGLRRLQATGGGACSIAHKRHIPVDTSRHRRIAASFEHSLIPPTTFCRVESMISAANDVVEI
jgi:hypothetical protein